MPSPQTMRLSTLLRRFVAIRDRHERSGIAIQWNGGLDKKMISTFFRMRYSLYFTACGHANMVNPLTTSVFC